MTSNQSSCEWIRYDIESVRMESCLWKPEEALHKAAMDVSDANSSNTDLFRRILHPKRTEVPKVQCVRCVAGQERIAYLEQQHPRVSRRTVRAQAFQDDHLQLR